MILNEVTTTSAIADTTTTTTTTQAIANVVEETKNTVVDFITNPKFFVPVIAIVVAWILIIISKRILGRGINKDSKSLEAKKKNTIIILGQNIIKYVIVIIAFLVILSSWGVDVTAMIAGLGIAGAIAGLAFQDALKDIIMGCNIILDNYFVIGDLVTYHDFTGEVIEFGLKNTKIKNVDGTVLIIANRQITEIKNLSQKSCAVLITVPTAYEEDSEKVLKVLDGICESINKWPEVKKDTEVLGVDNLNNSSVDYLIKAYCDATERYNLKRKILALVKSELDKNNVKIPYPQVEVHNGK